MVIEASGKWFILR